MRQLQKKVYQYNRETQITTCQKRKATNRISKTNKLYKYRSNIKAFEIK